MKCWDSKKHKVVITPKHRAYEKTTCGNKKWCIKGRCVYDSAAPTTTGMQTAIDGIYKIALCFRRIYALLFYKYYTL